MKRREFLKWSGLSSIMSLMPISLFSKVKTYKIEDICERHHGNPNIFNFKENEFSKRISDELIKSGSIRPENTFQYFLGFHKNILPYKENYTKNEIDDFINGFLSEAQKNGFATFGSKDEFPFSLFLEVKHVYENQIHIDSKEIGYRFNGDCCRKDGKPQFSF